MSGPLKREFQVTAYSVLVTIGNPQKGDRCWVDDQNSWYAFNGTSWQREGVLGGSQVISVGVRELVVSLPHTYPNTNYSVPCQMANYTDLEPQLQPVHVVQKTVTQFKVLWNVVTDSPNYLLEYAVHSF